MIYEAFEGINGADYKIMIVDDIPINTKLLEKILEKVDFRLSIFNNSQQAFDSLLDIDPDIILLDVMMPGLDGVTFLTRLRADHRFDHIHVIMVTAVSETEEIVKANALGVNDYITKPVNSKTLTSCIAKHIREIEAAK